MAENIEAVDSANQQVQPVAETSASGDSIESLKAKFALVQADSLKKGETNAELNERLARANKELKDLKFQAENAHKSKLEEKGEWEPLWKESEARNSTLQEQILALQNELAAKDSQVNAERLRNSAMAEIAKANALNPDHLLTLLESQTQLREIDGRPVVMSGGAAIPLADHLLNLKQPSSGWASYFSASGAKGMNATPSASGITAGIGNPYKGATKNLTQALALERENPDLAALLKAEALG